MTASRDYRKGGPSKARGNPFGIDRLGAVIRAQAAKSAEQIVAAIRDALSDCAQTAPADDDRTILLIKRT